MDYQEDSGLRSLMNAFSRPLWYDLDGKPIRPITAADYQKIDKLVMDGRRFIRKTWLKDGRNRVTVSTIHLITDHQFSDGPPVLWETMIFGGTEDGSQWRYTSRADAKRGHRDAVHVVRLVIATQRARRARLRRMHANYKAKWA